jgi:predicted nucleotidyltransferase
MIPEHGDDGHVGAARNVREHLSLLGEPEGREIAREQNQIRVCLHPFERGLDLGARLVAAMDVRGGGDADSPVVHAGILQTTSVTDSEQFDQIKESLKKAAAVLQRAGVPFLLGGALAAWARGGPESSHDLDLLVKPEDAERALEALAEEGLRTERPPENWLLKAWDGEVLIDLIFAPSGKTITDENFDHADELEVNAVRMKVASLEDVLTAKLLALNEHEADFESVLEIARAVREQVDWAAVRTRTSASPFANAFFTLADELGIVPARAKA